MSVVSGDAASRRQHAVHLPNGSLPVGEELQALLHQHQRECHIRKRQRLGVALDPLDLALFLDGDRSRDVKHHRAVVEARNMDVLAKMLLHGPRHDPGSTGDIEDVVTGARLRTFLQ
jgi:hypothetical protein